MKRKHLDFILVAAVLIAVAKGPYVAAALGVIAHLFIRRFIAKNGSDKRKKVLKWISSRK